MHEDPRQQTVPCPSCGEANFVLDLRCHACGAYVRERVPALNLFSTLWGMIEAPGATVLRIGRSEQKNYTHLLFALTGPVFLAAALFASRIGDSTLPFAMLLLFLAVFGPLLGLVLFPLSTIWLRFLLRTLAGCRVGYRDAAAWIAWSLSPLMWASVLLLPLQLGLHGMLLFSTNPAPWEALALPFWSLGIPTVPALPWSMLLLPMGFRVYGLRYGRMLGLLLLYWLFPAGVVIAVAWLAGSLW